MQSKSNASSRNTKRTACPHTTPAKPKTNPSQFAVFDRSGPPLRSCELCNRRFKDWKVPDEQWQLIPEAYQQLELCEEDFIRLVQQQGHSTQDLRFDRSVWEKRCALWREDKDSPVHHWKIRFAFCVDEQIIEETLWCEVLEEICKGLYRVRLRNTAYLDSSIRKGAIYRASWDGCTLHGISGRPLLEPIGPVKRTRRYAPSRTTNAPRSRK
jgi:hypothetical protein